MRARSRTAAAVAALMVAGCGSGGDQSPRRPSAPPQERAGVAVADVRSIAIPFAAGATGVAGGSVWVAPHLDAVALRIDPASGRVTKRVPLHDLVGAEMAAEGPTLWFSVSRRRGFEPAGLIRLDPRSGKVLARTRVDAVFPKLGAGRLWAAGTDGELFALDPRTGATEFKVSTGDLAFDYAVGAREVWVSRTDELKRIDVRTRRVRDFSRLTRGVLPYPHGGPASNVLPVRVRDGVLWAVADREIWALDARTGRVLDRLRGPEGVVYGPEAVQLDGRLWFAAIAENPPGTVLTAVDPEARRIVAGLRTKQADLGIASGFGSLWLPRMRMPEIMRIDPS